MSTEPEEAQSGRLNPPEKRLKQAKDAAIRSSPEWLAAQPPEIRALIQDVERIDNDPELERRLDKQADQIPRGRRPKHDPSDLARRFWYRVAQGDTFAAAERATAAAIGASVRQVNRARTVVPLLVFDRYKPKANKAIADNASAEAKEERAEAAAKRRRLKETEATIEKLRHRKP